MVLFAWSKCYLLKTATFMASTKMTVTEVIKKKKRVTSGKNDHNNKTSNEVVPFLA